MTIRVGFDGAMLNAPHTGSGQYSMALIAALRAAPDIDLVLLTPEPIASEPEAVVVEPPTRLRSVRARKVWWEQIGIGRAARRAHVDLVHVPYFAAPVRQRIPYIVTVHDVIPLLFPIYAGGQAMRAYVRLVSFGTRRAAQVIVDSDCSRRDAIGFLGLQAGRVTAIPLAMETDFITERSEPDIARVREQYCLDGTRVIFNTAGLDVRKNVGTLIRAFARARTILGDDVRLVIGGAAHGNPRLYPDLAPLVRELGVGDSVIFTGRISQTDKIALYHLADCYAAPSRYEGFGLTPLDAMACGTPVIAANASCTSEVVGDAAILVPPDDVVGFADAFVRVLTDDDVAQTMRAAGIRQAAQFSWERTATATRAVYHRALDTKATVPAPAAGEQPVEMAR